MGARTNSTHMSQSTPPINVALLRDPGHLLAVGLGSGLAPFAPGTFGSALGLLLALPLIRLGVETFALATLVMAVLSVPLCGRMSRALGVHDHGGIVLDEFAGVWLNLLTAVLLTGFSWPVVAAAFFWFRVFDIAKPWPVSVADRRFKGGFGIVADDLLAGLFGGFAVWGTMALFEVLRA